MTTAHRPTFDPARGKDAQRGPAYHQRLLPAHKTLKYRQALQGTESETSQRDLKAELLRAEKAHYDKIAGRESTPDDDTAPEVPTSSHKRTLEEAQDGVPEDEEGYEAKRQRVLAETAAEDASSEEDSDADDDDSDDSDSDSDDDEAQLAAELAKIKRERAEAAAKEAAVAAERDADAREREIALGNPLLRPEGLGGAEYGVKRRWDDDVVFRNQARGVDEAEKARGKEFVNDMLRSDFHRKFMSRYVR